MYVRLNWLNSTSLRRSRYRGETSLEIGTSPLFSPTPPVYSQSCQESDHLQLHWQAR